jgi:hypothetical protein
MNTFICDKHGEFQSNAKMRAFCPECGNNVRRQYGEPTGETQGTADTGPGSGENPPTAGETSTETEDKQRDNGRDEHDTERQRDIGNNEKGSRKIRVTRKVRVKQSEKQPIKLNIKHKKVGRKVRPEIKERVVTNKQKADAHQEKESTVWQWVNKTAL